MKIIHNWNVISSLPTNSPYPVRTKLHRNTNFTRKSHFLHYRNTLNLYNKWTRRISVFHC